MEIHPWSDIADDFKDTLVLGNGASIAITSNFSYSSLFESATQKEQITKNIKRIFEHLDTKDFELVLRMLWHASHINKALEIEDSATSATYSELRTALVKTVRDIHVAYDDVKDELLNIVTFMKQFSTVFSLNYDLLVYWAMMLGNRKEPWFKDCFIQGEFQSDWEQYREPYRNARGSTLVFYPHGNLALATDIVGKEVKLGSTDSKNLLDTIIKEWNEDNYIPLFVSEGTTDQKSLSASRSAYINSVHNSVLPKSRKSVVIFGWAMSDNDAHIINAIAKSKPHSIAVSVLTNQVDSDEYCTELKTKLKKEMDIKDLTIKFFDAESEGCWVHPPQI